jgi:hypothetical protein
MDFTLEELNLIRQWFNAVEDLNPDYLEFSDRQLGNRIERFVFAQQRANQQSEDR